ncbi:ABC transporter, solute-binding protein [Peptoanaerobacter stomatis]|uniref:ABC transporter, solute-binding protein n=1 Tax=Peptoanaerobacter stomatis TaxID=796937 RepID=J6HAH8_9FIRM|nr:spermidine/putrescine ABC transporter substrate-binding protein [Peptoanaerobacter stomatis]EJU19873.1 ABC transporter, solute-binding protein [Peptoanaerobacter stomatis]
MKKIFISILLLTLFLTGCSSKNNDEGTKKSDITLNVYNWGDFIDPDVINMFEEETGIKVNYENFNNNEELLAKIEAGSTNYDVLFPSDYMVGIMREKGLLQTLDYSNIPNAKYIDERFVGLNYDPKQEYNVPYMWQTVGISYNSKVVTDPVDSWDILWNEKYKRNIIMLDSSRDTIGITLKKLGYSLNTKNDKELEEAKEELIKQKELVSSYQVDYYKTALIGGEADMSLAWSGDAMYIKSENPDFEYSIPKEGTNVSIDCMVIPTQSLHKKEAEMFINFMNKPEVAAKNAEYIKYSSPNLEAIKLLPDEEKNNPQMYPEGSIESLGEIFIDLGDYNQVYDKIWTQIKTAN